VPLSCDDSCEEPSCIDYRMTEPILPQRTEASLPKIS
jgi:hypothetical protein